MSLLASLYRRYFPIIAASLLLCVACKEKDMALGVGDARIAGTWLLYQRALGPDTNRVITRIPAIVPQTLTFSSDGHFSVSGDSLSYYRDVNYYRVDSITSGLELRLIANVQELPGEPQRLQIRRDTLMIRPYFSPTLQLSFVKKR